MDGPLTVATETPATTPTLRPLVDDLNERREKARLGGGPEKIAKQHEREKLTARERLDLLIDEGTFMELGIHGRPHFAQRAMDGVEAPAESSSHTNGMRFWSAISRRRVTFSSPVMPIDPAITVKSYAATATSRPSTRP